ncbi:sporulation protein YqfC [Syntrophomonas wolfei]|jgi:sporulation protein YqfC|nr:sporulation protein YqfC [Syntrophomonas wolfei]
MTGSRKNVPLLPLVSKGMIIRMERRRELLNKAMAEFLELPGDLVLDLPKITVVGRNELYLENHRGIIEYALNRLRINLSRGFLEIEGEELQIKTLMPEEMGISGEIHSIRFLD